MNAIDVQGYNKEITVLNENKIERVYLAGETVVFSEIVYEGKSREDAIANFYSYFEPKKTWYMSGHELKYV